MKQRQNLLAEHSPNNCSAAEQGTCGQSGAKKSVRRTFAEQEDI
jgi:hypothetical protein